MPILVTSKKYLPEKCPRCGWNTSLGSFYIRSLTKPFMGNSHVYSYFCPVCNEVTFEVLLSVIAEELQKLGRLQGKTLTQDQKKKG